MIGKQIKSQDFAGVLEYVLKKEGAELIGGNMVGIDSYELAAEFKALRQLRPNLKRAVYHASLSQEPGVFLDDITWQNLTAEYLKCMGFQHCPYIVVRHTDTFFETGNERIPRDHIHIIASRIREDGSVVNESWDYQRSEIVLRNLEREYKLTPAPPSNWTRDLLLPTQLKLTGKLTVKPYLKTLIDKILPEVSDISELVERLEVFGVNSRINYSEKAELSGISFKYDDVALSGSELGRAYTAYSLVRRLNEQTSKPLVLGKPALLTESVLLRAEQTRLKQLYMFLLHEIQRSGEFSQQEEDAMIVTVILRLSRQPEKDIKALVWSPLVVAQDDPMAYLWTYLNEIQPLIQKFKESSETNRFRLPHSSLEPLL